MTYREILVDADSSRGHADGMHVATAAPRSSAAWWAETREDPERLVAWLFAQYRGEVTAAERIVRLRDTHAAPGTRAHRLLGIAALANRFPAVYENLLAHVFPARSLEVELRRRSP